MRSEVARFRPDDPDPLVQASFACSLCLREPTVAGFGDGDDAVTCRCDRCGDAWLVLLTGEQWLRLQLRPPWRGMATVVRPA